MTTRKTSFLRLLALLATFLLVLGACGGGDDTDTETGDEGTTTTEGEDDGDGGKTGSGKAVKLAYVGPLTGDAANLGINIRNGAKLAVEQAKKDGVKVELVEFDTKGDPAEATTVQARYINDESIIGVVGPAFSGETKAALPGLQDKGLAMISASATNKDLPTVVPTQTVFHRVIADDTFQGKGIGEYIASDLKPKSLAIVHDNSEYGKGLAEDVKKSAGSTKIGTQQVVDPKSQDFSAAVNALKSGGDDVIFYSGYYAEAGRLKKQLTDAGVKATFISGDGSLDPGFITAAGAAAAEGSLLSCPCNLATDASPGELGTFFKDYKTLNKIDPGTYSPEAYDVATIFIDAIREGADTREAVVKYLEEDFTSLKGISKNIEFEENGNVKETGVFVFEVKGGKIVSKKTPS